MTEHQHSADAEADAEAARPGEATTAEPSSSQGTGFASGMPRSHGRSAPWGDGLRMIAVTTERLAMVNCSAGTAGYLPTVPADSEEPALD